MPVCFARRLVAEGLGTLLLVATVVGSGIMAERLADGQMALALLANTLATVAVLVALIVSFSGLSSHFNPVVSLVMAVRGALLWREFPALMAVQVAGACLGTLLAHAMFSLPLWQFSGHARSGAGQWLSEGVATFGLVMVILACRAQRPPVLALVVAAWIAAAYWFTASTSFANPAVTIARCLSNTFAGIAPGDVPAFILAQIAGGVLAARVSGWLFR